MDTELCVHVLDTFFGELVELLMGTDWQEAANAGKLIPGGGVMAS